MTSDIIRATLSDTELDLFFSYDGSARLVPRNVNEPYHYPYVQAPLVSPIKPEDATTALTQAYLSWDTKSSLQDISLCGHVFTTSFNTSFPPASTPNCSLPTCLLETSLPDGPATATTRQQPPAQDSVQDNNEIPWMKCGWRERFLSLKEQAESDPAGLRARLLAREGGSGGDWRGFSVSEPYKPGGGASLLDAGPTSLIRDAESGLWLNQLQQLSVDPLSASSDIRVQAPGLPYSIYGQWHARAAPKQSGTYGEVAAAGPDSSPAVNSAPAEAIQQENERMMSSASYSPAKQGVTDAQQQRASTLSSVFDNMWMLEDEEDAEEEEDDLRKGPELDQGSEVSSALSRLNISSLSNKKGSEEEGAAGDLAAVVSSDVDSLLNSTEEEANAALTARGMRLNLKQAKVASSASSSSLSRMPLAGQSSSSVGAGHEWAVRANMPDFEDKWSQLKPNLALHYPFELDVFQKEAILHMEAGNSVFVAAHTSAGKTVVAEYAFALATRHCTRAVYTSPIKTISNQKFRDFSGKFEVGLLTGDVQLKTTSPCLIMTTEILRSMLYKGADVIRDVEWVVFDEVHYVNDADRGVVWEEVIIMLPPHVNIVMLSATVPNVMDFADWVGRTRRKVVQVTGTAKRPVPLEHSLYYNGEMYVINSREQYVPEGVRQANIAWKKKNEVPDTRKDEKAGRPTGRGTPINSGPNQSGGRGGGPGGGGGGRGGGGGGFGHRPSGADAARKQLQGGSSGNNSSGAGMRPGERGQLLELISMLGKKQLLPVAFFCFSKKRCDSSADGTGGVDLTTAAEKHTIHVFVEKCLARLNEGDRKLPQICRLRDLMRRGLAVHHAGLLPIMKEVVEMLFCQGYIKVLFCTETFAMGVNAPTRTVVFHSLRKHDGKNFRFLLPSEYTQMAGRAGRRGLDPVGTVLVACWEDVPPENELRTMLTGRGVSLESQFRLTYSMILSLLRVEDLKVEDMLKRSFAEWRAQRSQPKALGQLQDIDKQLVRVRGRAWPDCQLHCQRHELEDYYAVNSRIEDLNVKLQERVMQYKSVQQALVPGRAVLYSNPVNGLTELALVLGDVEEAPASKGSGISLGSIGKIEEAEETRTDRKMYILVQHRFGSVDDRHMKQIEAARQLKDASTSGSSAKLSSLKDEFSGMVLRAPGGSLKGKGGVGARGAGPLPKYGNVGGYGYLVAEVGSRELIGICKSKLKIEVEDILCGGEWEADTCKRALLAALKGLLKLQEEAVPGSHRGSTSHVDLPLMDWRSDLRVTDLDTHQLLMERQALMLRRSDMKPHRCPSLSEQYNLVRTVAVLERTKDVLQHQLSDASLQQMPEFHQRVRVLQQLGYLDEDSVVTLKGRVACEINSTQDELLASEAIFAGLLTDLSPAESVALISALVFQEKSAVEPELPPALAAARDNLEALTKSTAEVQRSHGLQIDPQEYVRDALHCGLMQVVYEWAQGTPFDEICTLTDVMEGSIVRAVVRLDQACRDLMDAARVMGNTTLFQQMQAASEAIKRDVIFAASLYVA
ncbi:hypothetical protein CEUSTIGMA_g4170.t1 [Chlamydomonas eustigma]|uniref:Helicase ATP-binding domain-containing protein n=1 Tax=Chlamydomonas eustigma TaxID=1157962 RepID=A0A250X0X0_9CHLO|nr:hypothetical protein CEUSTIGMA_g4170.t1 [Chlamydomonas eustigma]|eukprot:GAX76723.1 hypothetical protein CEUSTIGMA_g4170.t1 [Chlamydomonas eustigma]